MSVPEYTTTPFSFKIDGTAYTMKRLGFGDLEQAAEVQAAAQQNPLAAIKLMHELLSSKTDKRTMNALNTLDPSALQDLFKRWAGITPGESSTSGE
ncbi:hypothetical protein [Agromyces sp. SYSU T00194]|uniref:hypothetical protein n=1 Tax=Agromyces chitinivorans TaxID=3158560 RepID=UPI0033926596